MSKPLVFVGPSGIGKGTIIKGLRKLYPERFAFSVSHTTRSPREGERDGIDYHFVTREQFEADLAAGKFLEHAEVHGNYYGTSYDAIRQVERSGKICILDVNVDGAIAIAHSRLKPFIILLAPSNFQMLERRLRKRGTEDEETIQKRLATSRTELQRFEENKELWNLIVINESYDKTMVEISTELFKRYPLP